MQAVDQKAPEAPETDRPDYDPIESYAAIGDCHGSALIGRTGSVDWACLDRLDADPAFCRILDAARGGYFSLKPKGLFQADRAYVGDTNVLRTEFRTDRGAVTVTDFMAVGRRPGAGTHDYVSLNAPGWLIRIVECLEGAADLAVRYRPTVDFAASPAHLEQADAGWHAGENGPWLWSSVDLSADGDMARGSARLSAGDTAVFIVSARPVTVDAPAATALALRDVTLAFWQEWIAYCRYDGPQAGLVRRSALALKLLTYAPTGAIVAALTTSLPEEIGGERNWDYRYCWLRDSAFTLYALSGLGYSGEAERFGTFLQDRCLRVDAPVHVLYTIDGSPKVEERELDHLKGYRDSQPVRVGNDAYDQRQLDIFGQILDWAHLHQRLGARFDADGRDDLTRVADFVAEHWREPDQGLWEMRGPPRHHVHGKVMGWVALDRAIKLLGSNDGWAREREAILSDVEANGLSTDGAHFVQAYGETGTDAALLLLPAVAFPSDRDRLAATVAAVQAELAENDFVHRYRGEDGLEGGEGAFLICSFWLVDALLHLGRYDEAETLFENLAGAANDVGLYAEEIAPDTGAFLGNFPQAFTHLALIGSAFNLALYRKHGVSGLAGSYADRASLGVTATRGWRAVWAALKHTGRLSRLFPSRRSVLAPSVVGQGAIPDDRSGAPSDGSRGSGP
ncbi:MAG: glycoside hydrolase family 15 protein [Inquilinaceae bacterium]